jgi:predicted transcriptional regulator
MKLKKVRIVVEGVDATSRRWVQAIRGRSTRSQREEVISVPSWEVLARVLSAPRLEILAAVPALRPLSIAALARALKRDFKNVHADVKFLADVGLLVLREGGPRGTLAPTALYSEIDLPLAA